MVKLLAIETALVGWLAYWLFLLYSGNPIVAGGLASQLSKFPQLSFTTVDITVLVIIALLSIFLAFKFERGLKPGIRLERALQMLESLMKRNLMLEAQIAEVKMEKAQITTAEPASATSEPPPGSWEKAFRTPIEAGPSSPSQTTRPFTLGTKTAGFEREVAVQRPIPARLDPKPPQVATQFTPQHIDAENWPGRIAPLPEKPADRQLIPATRAREQSGWEDSPKYLGEAREISTPLSPARKQGAVTAGPAQRQPYIPAPAQKAIPPSVVLGPGVSPVSQARPLARSASAARPVVSPQSGQKTTSQGPPAVASVKPLELSTLPIPSLTETTRSISFDNSPGNSDATAKEDNTEAKPKTNSKASVSVKKRFPWEDD